MIPTMRNRHAAALILLTAAACGSPAAPVGGRGDPLSPTPAMRPETAPAETELATFALG